MDQIFHDVCLQKLPVVLCIDRSGLVGQDGQTHQGIYDLAFLRQLNLPIMAPANAGELARMLPMALQIGQPCAIRYCKYLSLSEETEDFAFGQWSLSEDGGDAALVSFGSMLEPCTRAAEILRAEGRRVAVVNARFLNPLDDAALRRLHAFRTVCVAEDNRPVGGLAEAIRMADPFLPLLSVAISETAVKHGEIATQRKENGLDADSLADLVRKALV